MKHRIELTPLQEQMCMKYPGTLAEWLNDNLSSILKTERIVVTEEMILSASDRYQAFGQVELKGLRSAVAFIFNNYVNKCDRPDTFIVDGKTFIRHTPGDPMPCDGETMVDWTTEETLKDKHIHCVIRAGTLDWNLVTGYRLIEESQLQEANNLLDRAQEQMNADSIKLALRDQELQEEENESELWQDDGCDSPQAARETVAKLRESLQEVQKELKASEQWNQTRQESIERFQKEVERLKEGWRTCNQESNSRFNQSCINLQRAEKAEKELQEAQNKVNDLELVLKGQEEWNNRAQKLLDGGRWAGSTYIEGCVTELEESRAKIDKLERENEKLGGEISGMYHELGTKSLSECNREFLKAIKRKAESPAQLLPITDPMPPVPEGCVRQYWGKASGYNFGDTRWSQDTHYLDIQLPKTPDPLEKEQQKFEKWMKGLGYNHNGALSKANDKLRYIDYTVEVSWQAWRAARSSKPL